MGGGGGGVKGKKRVAERSRGVAMFGHFPFLPEMFHLSPSLPHRLPTARSRGSDLTFEAIRIRGRVGNRPEGTDADDALLDADFYDEHDDLKLPPPQHCQPLVDVAALRELDTVYCQVDFFDTLRAQVLPLLTSRIILITGQWFLPNLEASQALDEVADHPMVAHWFAQNPVLDHPKYTGIPYGIRHTSLSQYAAFLLRRESSHQQHETRSVLANLPVTRETSHARRVLPAAAPLPYDEFLQRVAGAAYLVSPAGDRADTYRHAEAIGLGTIPICDCPPQFRGVYGASMLRARLSGSGPVDDVGDGANHTILEMIQHPSLLSAMPAGRVQRELILASYWSRIIPRKKAELERARAGARDGDSPPCWMRSRSTGGKGARDEGQPFFEGKGARRQPAALRLAPTHESWYDEEILTRERRLQAAAAAGAAQARAALNSPAPSGEVGGGAGKVKEPHEPAKERHDSNDGEDRSSDRCGEAFVRCRLWSRRYQDAVLLAQVLSLRDQSLRTRQIDTAPPCSRNRTVLSWFVNSKGKADSDRP